MFVPQPKAIVVTCVLGAAAVVSAFLFSFSTEQSAEGVPRTIAGGDASVGALVQNLSSIEASRPTRSTGLTAADEKPTLRGQAGYNPAYPSFADRIVEIGFRRDKEVTDVRPYREALQRKAAWEEDESVSAEFEPDIAYLVDPRNFLKFDPVKLESLVDGDELELPIPMLGQSLTMVVERVEVHEDSEAGITWHGSVKEFTTQNQVSFTQSDTTTYGGIFTPHGLYALQAKGSHAWIADANELFQNRCEELHPESSDQIDAEIATLEGHLAANSIWYKNPKFQTKEIMP